MAVGHSVTYDKSDLIILIHLQVVILDRVSRTIDPPPLHCLIVQRLDNAFYRLCLFFQHATISNTDKNMVPTKGMVHRA